MLSQPDTQQIHNVFSLSCSSICLFDRYCYHDIMNGLNGFDRTDRNIHRPLLMTSGVEGLGHSRPSRSDLVNTVSHELLEQSR